MSGPRQPSASTPPAGTAVAHGDPWLARVRELKAIAEEGLLYAEDSFDLGRYRRLRELAVELTVALVAGPPERIALLLDAEPGYVTPKLDVRAAVHDPAGRILLVRETQDDRWSLPGGWADIGQTLAESAIREVFEESGYVVTPERLLGIYDRERWGHRPMLHHMLKAVLRCRLVAGSPTTSAETSEVGWFARDELPPLSVSRTSPQLLARVFEHWDDDLPADL